MAVAESSSADRGFNPQEDAFSPYFLHHSKNHNSVIVTPKLTSSNFPSWKQSFLLAISIRNKQGFLDGSIPKPSPENYLYLPWIRCNNLIVAWLLRSISQGTKSVDAYFTKLNVIWEELRVFRPLPSCSYGKCNSKYFLKYAETLHKYCVFKFLYGLNETHQGVCSQLIMMKPFPSLDRAYFLRQETQRSMVI